MLRANFNAPIASVLDRGEGVRCIGKGHDGEDGFLVGKVTDDSYASKSLRETLLGSPSNFIIIESGQTGSQRWCEYPKTIEALIKGIQTTSESFAFSLLASSLEPLVVRVLSVWSQA